MHHSLDPIPLPSSSSSQVPMALFRRHMGLPACADLDERLEALFDQAKTWYQQYGEPWTDARQVSIQRIVYDVIHLEHQQQLTSALLARGLARARAHAIFIVAVSAGKAVDEQIDELWNSGRVDEAMFLNAYAIATVEHLRWQVGDHLRNSLGKMKTTVLPHYSPGYDGWDLADQARLYQLIRDHELIYDHERAIPIPLHLLPSGGLRPSKSTLAAYGVTRSTNLGQDDLEQYWSCRAAPTSITSSHTSYAFPEKALTRWRDKRLKVIAQANDELLTTFRFDGSTCTNMGVPLAFDYVVRLKTEKKRPVEKGPIQGDTVKAVTYRILNSSCLPVESHSGYQSMCAYLDQPDRLMGQLRSHQPLVGQLLSQSLSWQAPTSPASCLCTRASQDHKWRIVLQTLHFALEEHE